MNSDTHGPGKVMKQILRYKQKMEKLSTNVIKEKRRFIVFTSKNDTLCKNKKRDDTVLTVRNTSVHPVSFDCSLSVVTVGSCAARVDSCVVRRRSQRSSPTFGVSTRNSNNNLN